MSSLSKEKRNQLISVGFGTLAVVIGLWQMMIVAQKSSLRNAVRRVTEQQGRLDSAERLIKSLPEIQKTFEVAQTRLKTAETEMASGDMYSWIIQTVNTFRTNYHVEIPQISRETPCEVGLIPKFPYTAVQFALRGTAHYHEFGRFVADFENRFPYMRVQKVELEPAGNTSATTAASPGVDDAEKLSFRMEIVALVNPNSR
jgi:hypothetical protein